MSKDDEHRPAARTRGRLFVSVTPSAEDLVRASAVPAGDCPWRYCWWWHSLSFDWELPPLGGCTFLASPKPPRLKDADVPCPRCDPSSAVDHYEPREPHLEGDGFEVSRWLTEDQHRRPEQGD